MSDLQSGDAAEAEALPEAPAPGSGLAELERRLMARGYGAPLPVKPSEEMTEEELREAFDLMRYALIRVIESSIGEVADERVAAELGDELAEEHWSDLCRDAQEGAKALRDLVESFPEAKPFVSAGPDWSPDWVLLGGPNFAGGGSVFILHSTALTGAEMKRENKGLAEVKFAGRVARIPKIETTVRVQLSEFGTIYGEDYRAALSTIMGEWERKARLRPPAIESGSGV